MNFVSIFVCNQVVCMLRVVIEILVPSALRVRPFSSNQYKSEQSQSLFLTVSLVHFISKLYTCCIIPFLYDSANSSGVNISNCSYSSSFQNCSNDIHDMFLRAASICKSVDKIANFLRVYTLFQKIECCLPFCNHSLSPLNSICLLFYST